MAATYEPIATTTLGSATNLVTFSSIPGTYTDLVIVIGNVKMLSDNDSIDMYFNNDTATNYSYTFIQGTGSVAASSRATSQAGTANTISQSALLSTNPGQIIVNIFNYAGSTYKTSLARATGAGTGGTTEALVNLWRSTAAITRIDLRGQGTETISSGSTFTLYGIKAA